VLPCCSVLQCVEYVAVCCSVLQCVAVCCSVLQCVAVWCAYRWIVRTSINFSMYTPCTHIRTIHLYTPSHSYLNHSFTYALFIHSPTTHLHTHHSLIYAPFIYIGSGHSCKHHSFISADSFTYRWQSWTSCSTHCCTYAPFIYIRTIHLYTHHAFTYRWQSRKSRARLSTQVKHIHMYTHTHSHISTNFSLSTITLHASKTIFEIMVRMWMNGAFVKEWCVYELTKNGAYMNWRF